MRRINGILGAILVLFVAGNVCAQAPHWKYVEGGWGYLDPDFGSSENGWFVRASFDLGKLPLHFFGEYGDYGPLETWQVGGGWHGLLGERADLFADGAFYDFDVEDGFKVRFGARWMVTERLELKGNLGFADLDLRENKSLDVNAIFNLSRLFAVGGGYEWGSEFNQARAFLRFNFGRRK
jgi:hypothetical protein